MRYLYLLRHAKSSWDDPSLDDFDRPLAPRGIKACQKMRVYLEAAGIKPQLVLCSSAERAWKTCELIAEAFPKKTQFRFEHGLYEASSQALLKPDMPDPMTAIFDGAAAVTADFIGVCIMISLIPLCHIYVYLC